MFVLPVSKMFYRFITVNSKSCVYYWNLYAYVLTILGLRILNVLVIRNSVYQEHTSGLEFIMYRHIKMKTFLE